MKKQINKAIIMLMVLCTGCAGLKVFSVPAGAKILVDGKYIGKNTPTRLSKDEVGRGKHKISVEFPCGTMSKERDVHIGFGWGTVVGSAVLFPIGFIFFACHKWERTTPRGMRFVIGRDNAE